MKKLLLGLLFFPASLWAAQIEIVFAAVAEASPEAMQKMMAPMLADMEKATGFKTRFFPSKNYGEIVSAMRQGKVHVAWMGGASAAEAVDMAGAEVFACGVDQHGSIGYKSLLVTRSDAESRTLNAVLTQPGKYILGFGDPLSTSGNLVPGYFLFAQNQINPAKHFIKIMTGSHEANILAVLERRVDVATTNTKELERFRTNTPGRAGEIRILWESPPIPGNPLVYLQSIPETSRKSIRTFFLEYGKQPHEKNVLRAIQNTSGFKASGNSLLRQVRELKLAVEREQVENDPSLSSEARRHARREIRERFVRLSRDSFATGQ